MITVNISTSREAVHLSMFIDAVFLLLFFLIRYRSKKPSECESKKKKESFLQENLSSKNLQSTHNTPVSVLEPPQTDENKLIKNHIGIHNGVCIHNGIMHKNREEWKVDDCTECTCQVRLQRVFTSVSSSAGVCSQTRTFNLNPHSDRHIHTPSTN